MLHAMQAGSEDAWTLVTDLGASINLVNGSRSVDEYLSVVGWVQCAPLERPGVSVNVGDCATDETHMRRLNLTSV
jgi:hypothetical protein